MKLISWNVNGIRAAARNGFMEWLADYQPTVLCLQETKAHKEQIPPDLAEPDGYHTVWYSAKKKGYSSVATFSRSEPHTVIKGIGEERFDNEGRLIETHYDDFVLLNGYFPNGQRDLGRVGFKLEFSDAVMNRGQQLRAEGKNVVICGDYNTAHREIDLKNPKSNEKSTGFLPEERAWIDKFIQHGYVDTFRQFNQEPGQYTWWTYRLNARERNIGWRIDYFFVNQEFMPRVKDAFILPEVMGSDHCPVGIELDLKS
jgi:exodeoxyribonuclease-3